MQTTYRRGLLRLLLVVSVFWFVGWVSVINIARTDSRHFDHIVMLHKGEPPKVTYLTFANSGSMSINQNDYEASVKVALAQREHRLHFASNDPNVGKVAAAYARNLPEEDSFAFQKAASLSGQFSVAELLRWALGVPAFVLALSALGVFLYRGFRPKQNPLEADPKS